MERVVPGETVDGQDVRRLFAGDSNVRCEARDRAAADAEAIGSGGAVDVDLVGLSVVAAEVGVDVGDAGAAEVVDGDRVGAAAGGDVDVFDSVGVHGDVGDVAEQP